MTIRWRPFLMITCFAVVTWALLLYLNGCAPEPRFLNGDRTAKAQFQEVVESDMPQFGSKPETIATKEPK